MADRKTAQLQIRVSARQKRAIRKRARQAGMSMSDWVLTRLLPPAQRAFQDLVDGLSQAAEPSYVFAEILELLGPLGAAEYERAVSEPPRVELDAYWANYLAATLEQAAAMKGAEPPPWVRDVPPLEEPVFGSSLRSLRMHLLTNSPPPFTRRNIFIDSSVGDRA